MKICSCARPAMDGPEVCLTCANRPDPEFRLEGLSLLTLEEALKLAGEIIEGKRHYIKPKSFKDVE